MTTNINIHEAKTHLSDLVERAMQGEHIVLCKRNKPFVELKPVVAPKPKMFLGGCPYKIEIPDSFFDPLSEDELALWNGEIVDTDPLSPNFVMPDSDEAAS